jgi:glycosyltransferase involved in cell wall biosynthesis
MKSSTTGILHYSAPPVIGGVEAVIYAHARVFVEAGYPVTVIAGRGEQSALPAGVEFVEIPLMDTQDPQILAASAELEAGRVPENFSHLVDEIFQALDPLLAEFDNLIVHNILGKHFNLPLTAALFQLLDGGRLQHCIFWGHDFTWTSPRSRTKVHAGYPWDLLRTYRPDVTYVVVSEKRARELAGLLEIPEEEIHVVYNGVNPKTLLGLSEQGLALIEKLGLFEADLVMLMPVRVTQAKNIEFALRVTAELKESGLKCRLVLTGPPDPHDEQSMHYFNQLRDLRRTLGVEDEMRYVFESGPQGEEGYTIGIDVVGDLYRVCDLMFMPSHREGYGMPVLEAGLVGVPVFSSSIVPAALEIGGEDVILFDLEEKPRSVAKRIRHLLENDPIYHMRCRVRRNYTWRSLFRDRIEPLLKHKT